MTVDPSAPVVTPEIAAEAAMWVARLHGPSRTREMERQCLAWQARSPAHRHAFEKCSDTWMDIPSVARSGAWTTGGASSRPEAGGGAAGSQPARRWLLAAAGTVGAVAVLLAWQPWFAGDDYRTAVGEARTVVLADGTRMSLNTDTRVSVQLGSAQRLVRVEAGEAEFEVAKDARRPFVVRAAASEVVAVGTVFSVRLVAPRSGAGGSLAVTLIEGEVAVRSAADAAPLRMRAGDRLVVSAGGAVSPRVDRPPLDQVMAWKRHEAVFDEATLAEAVAEMNRYSRTPVVLLGPLAGAEWRVSGRFRTGDNAAFAGALASLHGLVVQEREGRLELSRGP